MWRNPYVHLKDIEHHTQLCGRLHRFISTWDDLPHLLICGPPGSGKKHIVRALLLDKFGSSVLETTRNTKKPYCITLRSPYHMEYFLTEKTGPEFTDELIRNVQFLNVATASFHVVVLHGLHMVSRVLQSTIRQIMDQQFRTVRFIIISRTVSRIDLVKDRCLFIRVPAISREECASICSRRSSGGCDGTEFWDACDGNLLDIFIHMEFRLQQQRNEQSSGKTRKQVKKQEYTDIHDIVHKLFIAISHKHHKHIQKYILELYVVPLDAHDIVRLIILHCVDNCTSDTSKIEVVRIGAKYDGTLQSVSNVVYSLIVLCYELTTVLANEIHLPPNKDSTETIKK